MNFGLRPAPDDPTAIPGSLDRIFAVASPILAYEATLGYGGPLVLGACRCHRWHRRGTIG